MKEMEIKAQYVKSYTIITKNSDFSSKLENILNEQFKPTSPNAVWYTDNLYLDIQLTSIMDLFSRKIIALTLPKTLEVSCVMETINKAKASRKLINPVIIHSDRGSQYVSTEYMKAIEEKITSYSKKAYPWDNACIESFHAIIKREWLNRFKIKDHNAYVLVFEYIEAFYNTVRIHSHCNYMFPAQFERAYEDAEKLNIVMAC